ncbi:MAG: glutamine--fructose-6-phosphate transaminase (isomerizing), partial [Ignavibacteriales bacterium]|nr:glutamine--fructose-6-phosphate transaminase (isomerizing) [Ignavibacteriales bacterium]
MCGIVGYIGPKNAIPILIEGLKRLEYRGYDSAGVGLIVGDKPIIIKNKGKVSELEKRVGSHNVTSHLGIGHTRWATHGAPNETNAHPHTSQDGTLFLIHNGIVENFHSLKTGLQNLGYKFSSDTDTEVIAHLIDSFTKKGHKLFKAVRLALAEIEGTYGLAIISSNEPDKIIVARRGSPLVLGLGDNENYIASDVSALIAHTKQVVYLEDGEVAEVTADGFVAKNILDEDIEKEVTEVTLSLEEIDKGGNETFMIKEIMEQPESITNSLRGRLILDEGTAKLGGIEHILDRIARSKRVIFTACGTSWHACLVGEYMFEQFLRIPTEVEYASEFRYRNLIIQPDDTIFFVS